jgi:hypothetical protein
MNPDSTRHHMHTSPHLACIPSKPLPVHTTPRPLMQHITLCARHSSPISTLARRGGVLEATKEVRAGRGNGSSPHCPFAHSQFSTANQSTGSEAMMASHYYSHCAPQGSSVWLLLSFDARDLIRAGDPREWLDARPPSSSQRSSVKVHTASQARLDSR